MQLFLPLKGLLITEVWEAEQVLENAFRTVNVTVFTAIMEIPTDELPLRELHNKTLLNHRFD